MNKSTNNVVFYILIIFFVLILLIGGFFAYQFFWGVKKNGDLGIIIDKDFNSIIDKKNQEAEQRKKELENNGEYAEYKNPPCTWGDKEFPHGTIKDFYTRSNVGVYESCDDFKKKRKCDNGFWLGDKSFKYDECKRTVDCEINGIPVKDGEEIELYSRNVVLYGDNCNRYKGKRLCKETVLTGDSTFRFNKCVVSKKGICKVKSANGEVNVLGDGRSHIFYSKREVEFDDNCANYSRNRICASGIVYGDSKYKYWSCSRKNAKNCITDNVEITHGSSRILYSKRQSQNGKTCKFFAQIRACNNGVLDGQEEYKYSECTD